MKFTIKSTLSTGWISALAVLSWSLYGYLCIQSFYYQGVYVGYSNGLADAGICASQIGSLCFSDGGPYTDLITYHVYLNWLFLTILVVKLLDKYRLLKLVLMTCLVFTFCIYVRMRQLKEGILSDMSLSSELIRRTADAEFFWIILIAAVLVVEVVLFLNRLFSERYRKSNSDFV